MAVVQADRKRAALSTVGRGSRGLVGFWDLNKPVVITGTALARSRNALQVLEFNKDENTLELLGVMQSPAEVWSLQPQNDQGQVGPIVVATRRGLQSSVEMWSLTGMASHSSDRSEDSHLSSSNVDQITALAIDGLILRALRSPYSLATCLTLTQMNAAVIEADGSSLRLKTKLDSGKKFARENTAAKLVDGNWIDINTVMLANQQGLCLFDVRTGQLENSISLKAAVEGSKPSTLEFWIPPHSSRLSSACCSIREPHILYGGCQDGTVRAFDIRSSSLLWQTEHAKNRWVSTIYCAPHGGVITGGTDGVVKYWGPGGEAIATFPQHDDTVTNVCSDARSFATVSYDGRLAINEIPIENININ